MLTYIRSILLAIPLFMLPFSGTQGMAEKPPKTGGTSVGVSTSSTLPVTIGVIEAFPKLRFDLPLDLQSPRDGSGRLFVVEQGGLIKVFKNDSATASSTTFLDLSKSVSRDGWEMGLLGMAFHPAFKTNGRFFVNYTAENPRRTVISEFRLSTKDANLADGTTEKIILTFAQPYNNHNGGGLVFGPDGYLYIGTGDGGSAGDPQNNAQNRKSLLGKMLRVDIDKAIDKAADSRNYAIPPDNPLVGNREGFREEIYAWGLRNPWRYSFDSEGRLWVGDVGQNAWEEVHLVEKGKNYGWAIMEGEDCFKPKFGCNRSGLELPIISYPHPIGASITGGFVYDGAAAPSLKGAYVYADFMTGRIWAARLVRGSAETSELLKSDLQISSFGIDEANELYLCSFDGKIYQFVER